MQELKEKFARWNNFTSEREAARAELVKDEVTITIREQISEQKALILREQAKLQMLKAQLTLSYENGTPYRKGAFDLQWAQKKTTLKAEVENLIAEQLNIGTSIPKLMKELGSRNPAWFYAVKENLHLYRGAAKEDMAHTTWEWSDATSVHRYGLGRNDANEWAFVLMFGAVDSAFEHEKCMFDFETGHFISGNHALFNSVTEGVRKQRSQMLAEILDGTYTKKIRRDTNPYFGVE